MFSVDNFYSFMHSSYGWDRCGIVFYKHTKDGSKSIRALQPYMPSLSGIARNIHYENMPQLMLSGNLILHDQEPFMKEYLDTYRTLRYETNNRQQIFIDMHDHELLLQHARTCYWPIFCHSEHNSIDIKWLQDHGVIACHYLWHGLIARDWFRHWKHDPDLQRPSENWDKRFLLYAREHTGTRQYRKTLLDRLGSIRDQIQYNWDQQKKVSSDCSASIDIDDARDTAIHLVAETVFDQKKVHVTEKIFKPMVMSQPFIVFSGAGTLEYIKSYGFRTFGSIWDESYDREPDHNQRLAMAAAEIEKLAALPLTQFKQVMQQCQDIVSHNRRLFFSEEFENRMLEELSVNVSGAIHEQNYRSRQDPGGSFFHVVDNLLSRGAGITAGMQKSLDQLLTMSDHDLVKRIKFQYPWFGR